LQDVRNIFIAFTKLQIDANVTSIIENSQYPSGALLTSNPVVPRISWLMVAFFREPTAASLCNDVHLFAFTFVPRRTGREAGPIIHNATAMFAPLTARSPSWTIAKRKITEAFGRLIKTMLNELLKHGQMRARVSSAREGRESIKPRRNRAENTLPPSSCVLAIYMPKWFSETVQLCSSFSTSFDTIWWYEYECTLPTICNPVSWNCEGSKLLTYQNALCSLVEIWRFVLKNKIR